MSDLTDDEYTVIMLAEQGRYMAPIGRWEKPILSLAARGFLVDKSQGVNFAITQEGRAALAKHEEAINGDLRTAIEGNNKIANARTQMQQSVEQAALHLSFAARAASAATGDSSETAIKKLSELASTRALELVKA